MAHLSLTYRKQYRRSVVAELIDTVIEKYVTGLTVGLLENGEPFGREEIAIPIWKDRHWQRVRYIRITERELRETEPVQLASQKIKAFLRDCPKGWWKRKHPRPT